MSKIISLLFLLFFFSCAREQPQDVVSKNKKSLKTIINHHNYNPSSYDNKYFNMLIKEVTFSTRKDRGIDIVEIEIKPTCGKDIFKYHGRFPKNSYVNSLKLINGKSSISAKLKCTDHFCNEVIVTIQDEKKNDKGSYPVLLNSKGANWNTTWSPRVNASSFDVESFCHARKLKKMSTLKLFVDHDMANEELGLIDSFSYQKNNKVAQKQFIKICQDDLQGTVINESLRSIKVGFKKSLRFEIGTLQFEHDDFIYAKCLISPNFKWSSLYLYEEGTSSEQAVQKVQSQCSSNLGGLISTDYKREVLKLNSGKWIAKIKCSSIKQLPSLYL